MWSKIKSMQKVADKVIASFSVNHLVLERGIYLSRQDIIDDKVIVNTFDIRMKRPNKEPVMNTAEIHTIEHIGVTWLRMVSKYSERIIYFGPMGCRTGFYLILSGVISDGEVYNLIKDMFEYIAKFKGDVPGATPEQCGNYLDQNLPMANYEAQKYLDEVLSSPDEKNWKYIQND